MLIQYLLLYPICKIQFNLPKTHFRVTGVKLIITKLRYQILKVILKVRKLGKIE